MSDIKELTQKILEFRNARNWKQYHTPKDMIISLNLEAAELLELVQWKTNEEFLEQLEENKEALSDELADILYWVLLISHDLGIDARKAMLEKLKKNAVKYPL